MNKGKRKGRGPPGLQPYGFTVEGYASSSKFRLALKRGDADLVPFHVLYRRAGGLCTLAAQPVCFLLAGAHGFFALPEGYSMRNSSNSNGKQAAL